MNDDVYSLTHEVRTLFNLMGAAIDRMHEESGVTAAMRAVMECLAGDQEKTVPEIARERSVSRQHIQVLVNALVERDLVASFDNPGHKRSSNLKLTEEGEALFRKMRLRERKTIETLGGLASRRDIATTLKTLRTFSGYFGSQGEGDR